MSDIDRRRQSIRSDLELEKQLDNITNKAVKQLERPATPPLIIPKHRYKEPIKNGTVQEIADLTLKDLAFQRQLADISNSAIIQDNNYIPPKVKSDITQEMIDDYKFMQSQPQKIAGITYKYHPVDFELEDENFNRKEVRTPDEIRQIQEAKEALVLEKLPKTQESK